MDTAVVAAVVAIAVIMDHPIIIPNPPQQHSKVHKVDKLDKVNQNQMYQIMQFQWLLRPNQALVHALVMMLVQSLKHAYLDSKFCYNIILYIIYLLKPINLCLPVFLRF